MKPAVFYEERDDGSVQCKLCPHNCVMKEGQVGICKTRKNVKGMLYSLNYGQLTSIAMDPIEKKPIFHFHCGEMIFSLGSWGCNFKCQYCQNWEISQAKPPVKLANPEQIVEMAIANGSGGIAYTYNEPMVWFEFMLDTSRLAAREGLYNVVVTNGYVSEEPLDLLLQSIHAMNIDLKGFNDDFYREIGGRREVVMKTIEKALKRHVHVEVTTLIIPTKNDRIEELEAEFEWIASLDKDIPLHLSRYHPAYKYDIPPTPVEELKKLYSIAKKYLNFVYLGNVWDPEYESTVCPDCGSMVIQRQGYKVTKVGMTEDGRCSKCGRQIAKMY
ncbi:MAG TPA: AmmeMemoRadiSam system radical SAM enzyme [Thermotogae bacterium]|nr:pyruvate formate lyase activating enzyme [Thermotogota bacterium]HCZ06495.1 AmmeMemoRadiSam system radical SAM enzyme [Thermotogota bacterium]